MCAKPKTQFIVLSSILLFSATSLSAQNLQDQEGPRSTKENSPYSRYGIGDLSNNLQTSMKGMGGAATAFIDPFTVNNFNPASYSYLKVTTLDFAFEGRSRNITLGDQQSSSGTATFSHLTLGVPLGKYGGMSFGLQPESSIYYNANDTQNVAGIGKAIYNYNGSGSLQYAYLGLSGAYKGFSLGAHLGYLFGNSRYNNVLQNIDTTQAYNAEFGRSHSIGGIYWKAGMMYQAKFKQDHYLNLGLTATLSQDIRTTSSSFAMAYQFLEEGTSIVRDTVSNSLTTGVKGILSMPANYSFGVHYGKTSAWNIGLDVRYSDWSKFNAMGDRTGIADQSYRLALGGEFTPDASAIKNYFSLVQYRLGVYYGKDYLRINNTDINYFGGTIGASFPFRKNNTQFGRLNTSLDVGKRGTTTNNLASEVYVRFNIGVSLNDIWFIKRKYD